nr:hypothetical protein [Tanacetum cinerariifolium]
MAQGNSSATVKKDKKEDNMKPPSLEKTWNVGSKNMEELRKSANKYVILSEEKNDKDLEDDYRWDRVNRNDKSSEEEDNIEETAWNIRGMSKELRQNDAKKFIQEENFNMCAFTETHLKTENIMKVGNKVVGDWDWDSNVQQTPSCCRVIVGWNPRLVKVLIINKSKQDILCTVELIPNKIRFYCTIVYASNTRPKRRGLWKELIIQKQIVKNEPWKCQTAYGIFLLYMVSGHSPVVLYIKNRFPKKKSSFRFSNFVADKIEFLNLVDEVWKEDVKDNLKSVQAQVDKDLHDEKLRKEAASTLNEFVEASKDEIKMLKQKAKIKWLNEGDKNTSFFHGILKSRRNKSRVDFIKDEVGNSYEGDVVNDQFVKL